MRGETKRNDSITRYLLGDLTEPEQTEIELAYFARPEKLEEVWAAENDLIDGYVRRQLSAGDRELFETNYLSSPGHRERVAFAARLIEAADQTAEESAETSIAARQSPTSGSWRAAWLRFGAIAAMSLLAATGVWLLIERARLNREISIAQTQLAERQRVERETADQLAAEREQGDKLKSELDQLREDMTRGSSPPPPEDRRSVLALFLNPTLVRGGSAQQITIPDGTAAVRLQMRVDQDTSGGYRTTVRTVEGREVWNQQGIKPHTDRAGKGTVSVTVPATRLAPNDYLVTLSVAGPGGETEEVGRYYFRVTGNR
jgi:hypothetical protein